MLGGAPLDRISVDLELVTPLLGGGARTREIDAVDVVRAPSIRGHLRFWWRALHAHEYAHPEELFHREAALWGRAGDDQGGRSSIEVRILRCALQQDIDGNDPPSDSSDGYALWPARGARGKNQPAAPRRNPGTVFRLEIRCPEEKAVQEQVRNSVRAWILFGGYGSRSRRGVGSLDVAGSRDRNSWLPKGPTRTELSQLFGRDILAPCRRPADDTPLLAGALMAVGVPTENPIEAWRVCLSWLSDFRQGQPPSQRPEPHDGRFARERGEDSRPGRSNWPEPDKARSLSGRGPWAHEPRHNANPVWPRAGFGLPIIARFQKKKRGRHPPGQDFYATPDPTTYELLWARDGSQFDRLASPLILRPLPLSGGRFAPCALWLNRSYPRGGKVVLKNSRGSSEAEFDVLVAPEDTPLFDPLRDAAQRPAGTRLRTAFLSWLVAEHDVTVHGL